MRNLQKGFTLVELLVVIAVIGVLATTVIINLGRARAKARDAKRISDLRQIKTALDLYFEDNGFYPPSAGCGWDCNGYSNSDKPDDWTALENELRPYLSKLPVDPLNSEYNCSPWQDCHIYTYGNVGRTVNPPQYDLTAALETNHPQRCGVKDWRYYFNDTPWCTAFGGQYSNRIYEASDN